MNRDVSDKVNIPVSEQMVNLIIGCVRVPETSLIIYSQTNNIHKRSTILNENYAYQLVLILLRRTFEK